MNLGELLPNETKKVYIEKGYSWQRVLFFSNIAALIGGILSLITIKQANLTINVGQAFIPLATTIISYVTIQSLMTDFRVLLINRNILRIAYVSMYILTIYNLTTNDLFKHNTFMVIVFTFILFLIFLFSSIGASDVRAMMVSMPYISSIGGYIAIYMFVIVLIMISLYMFIKRKIYVNKEMKKIFEKSQFTGFKDKLYEIMSKKEIEKSIIKEYNKTDKAATPVGPFMLAPFLLFLIIYPLII